MGPRPILKALSGEKLRIRFKANAEHVVEVVECPGAWLAVDDVERLVADCRQVVRACLGGQDLDYGLFGRAVHHGRAV